MKAQVATYVKTCSSCNRNKPLNCKPSGLLMPLQIPDAPWSSISVNFITNLPLSNGADTIMVVVDRFTKWAEFFPCLKSITAQGAAFILLKEVFSCHGLPKEIVSNQGTQFVSIFFLLLTKALYIKQYLLSAFHPNPMVNLRGLIKSLSIILDATPQTPRTIGLTYCRWLCLPTTAATTAPQRCPHLLRILDTISAW